MPYTSQALAPAQRDKSIQVLQVTLANLSDAQLRTKHAHWNIRGPLFISFHRLFDELHQFYLEQTDVLAERIQQLGGYSPGLAADLSASVLPDFPAGETDEYPLLIALAQTTSALAAHCLGVINKGGDVVTQDIYIELARGLDKYLWLLEAHLPDGPELIGEGDEDASGLPSPEMPAQAPTP